MFGECSLSSSFHTLFLPPTTDGWVGFTTCSVGKGAMRFFTATLGVCFSKKSPDHNRERAKDLYLPPSFDQDILCLVYFIPMTDPCDWYIFIYIYHYLNTQIVTNGR